MTPWQRLIGAAIASTLAIALGVLAAWPIYRTWWLLVPAIAGLVIGGGIAVLGARRFGPLATIGLLFGSFVLTVVPVAVPQSLERFPEGLGRGLLNGVAAVVVGWKQLLTLTLPVGTYQAVIVPVYLVFLLTAFLTVTVAMRAGRFAPLAALPLLVPVVFGTVFGSSAVSASLGREPFALNAPRETALWGAAAALGALWVWFAAGAARRAALRRGRLPGERAGNSGRAFRIGVGAAATLVALTTGLAVAPLLDSGSRQVPRDRIDPEIVLRERTSPLAAYRGWKRDAMLDAALFSVASKGALPERLSLAVLDAYDGVDFHVSPNEAGRFTRFPSGDRVRNPSTVNVTIDAGYNDIWVPTAGLGSVPTFSGPRAADLAEAFYVNRGTGAAIVVPGGTNTTGLAQGDGYLVIMQTGADAPLEGAATSDVPGIDLESMPELASWLKAQDQPATAEGLVELFDRLRSRGYLSHAISNGDGDGEGLWLERLAARYGTQFESSAGGHSIARIELLFEQLNTQERLVGAAATPEMLVAGIGDDEQFAAAGALVARALGFESRVVLGVRLGDVDAGVPGIPSCEAGCTGENVAAWVEVRGDQGSWVALDVSPQVKMRPTTLETGEQLPEFSTTPEERDAKEVDPPLGLGERSEGAEETGDLPGESWLIPVLRVVGLSLAALVLLMLPLLFLPFAKRRRTAVRRAEVDPELRALGAWQEMIDRAADSKVKVPAAASRSQIAEALGTDAARWAGSTVDRAVFSAQGLTEQDADWMWAAADADRLEREARLTRGQRLRASYALRSYGVNIVKWRAGAAESAAASQNEER